MQQIQAASQAANSGGNLLAEFAARIQAANSGSNFQAANSGGKLLPKFVT